MTPSARLSPDVTVVSPHLDDAAFSVGASISSQARAGRAVTVLTVFANEPESRGSAAPWDRNCGFTTAGEAAQARRLEDARACRTLGADPEWLPFPDSDNRSVLRRAEVAHALRANLRHGMVWAPMGPLLHPDHRLVAELVLEVVRPRSRIVGYLEQPYASWHFWMRRRGRREGTILLGRQEYSVSTSLGDWVRKHRAASEYRSQLPSLSGLPRARILAHELLTGGEMLRHME